MYQWTPSTLIATPSELWWFVNAVGMKWFSSEYDLCAKPSVTPSRPAKSIVNTSSFSANPSDSASIVRCRIPSHGAWFVVIWMRPVPVDRTDHQFASAPDSNVSTSGNAATPSSSRIRTTAAAGAPSTAAPVGFDNSTPNVFVAPGSALSSIPTTTVAESCPLAKTTVPFVAT